MCGIAGIIDYDVGVSRPSLSAMAESLVHRGPDATGVWVDGAAGFAHTRLAIRDLSEAGRQPMLDRENRFVVTYNGEIYNYEELRRELENHHAVQFTGRCDTEIIPYGYMYWGTGLFDRIEGMFAIAIWDIVSQELTLARDHVGIKPLYYAQRSSSLVFASEVKGLLASRRVEKCINPKRFHEFLATGYPGPTHSLLAGVEQLAPGTILQFSARDGISLSEYWRPTRTGDLKNPDDALDEFSEILQRVCSSQLASDVPLGVLQSGGIDSTLISLSVAKASRNVELHSVMFEQASFDESLLAHQVADSVHLPLSLHRFQQPDVLSDFREVVHHSDAQHADTGSLGYYAGTKAVAREKKVVLAGDGGDEFFAGYDTYKASRFATLVRRLPARPMYVAGECFYRANKVTDLRRSRYETISRFLMGLAVSGGGDPHVYWRRLVPDFMLSGLYGRELRPYLHEDPYRDYKALGETGETSFDRRLIADQRYHLCSVLAKVDSLSMAHSLEVRVPLLERKVLEFAGRCNPDLLLSAMGEQKWILRQTAKRLNAPHDVIRATKKGFNVPIGRLLRMELSPLLISESFEPLAEFIDIGFLKRIVSEHISGQVDHAYTIWPILVAATWMST